MSVSRDLLSQPVIPSGPQDTSSRSLASSEHPGVPGVLLKHGWQISIRARLAGRQLSGSVLINAVLQAEPTLQVCRQTVAE